MTHNIVCSDGFSFVGKETNGNVFTILIGDREYSMVRPLFRYFLTSHGLHKENSPYNDLFNNVDVIKEWETMPDEATINKNFNSALDKIRERCLSLKGITEVSLSHGMSDGCLYHPGIILSNQCDTFQDDFNYVQQYHPDIPVMVTGKLVAPILVVNRTRSCTIL